MENLQTDQVLRDAIEEEFPDACAHYVYTTCGRCRGKGTHGNEAFDGMSVQGFIEEHGYDEWQDFRENYTAGHYDVRCDECSGTGKVYELEVETSDPEVVRYVEEWHREVAEWRAIQAAEMRAGA